MRKACPGICGCGCILLAAAYFCGPVWMPPAAAFVPPASAPSAAVYSLDEETRLASFRKVADAEARKDYPTALSILKNMPRGSQDYLVSLRLSWLMYTAKEYRNAHKQFETTIRHNTEAIEPKLGYLLTLISEEKYADVEKPARLVLALHPENYYANLRLTYASRLQLKLQAAQRINQRMLALYPADPNFLIEQALTCAWSRKYDDARPYYQKVLLMDPDNKYANQALSVATGTRGRDMSAEAFRKAYQLEQERKYADAVAVLSELRSQKGKEYFVHIRLGWLNYLAGNFAPARSHYEDAIRNQPRAIEPLLGLLLPQLAEEQYSDAEQTARQALQLDSLNYLARLRLAYALRKQKKFAEAEKSNDLALKRYPTDVSLLLEQALCYQGQNRADEAVQFFKLAQLVEPSNATAAAALTPAAPARAIPPETSRTEN